MKRDRSCISLDIQLLFSQSILAALPTGLASRLVSVKLLHQRTHPVDSLDFLRGFSDFQYAYDRVDLRWVKRELPGGGRHEKREQLVLAFSLRLSGERGQQLQLGGINTRQCGIFHPGVWIHKKTFPERLKTVLPAIHFVIRSKLASKCARSDKITYPKIIPANSDSFITGCDLHLTENIFQTCAVSDRSIFRRLHHDGIQFYHRKHLPELIDQLQF